MFLFCNAAPFQQVKYWNDDLNRIDANNYNYDDSCFIVVLFPVTSEAFWL